tara:strand:- start:471 stop:740 length:270 start_codon:yes stop_codon:yes gene_type:complete
MITNKTITQQKKINEIRTKIWDVFEEHGGYEYNDEMYWQLQGFQDSMDECETDDDIVNMLNEASDTIKFFDWVVEYKELMEREPPQLYG